MSDLPNFCTHSTHFHSVFRLWIFFILLQLYFLTFLHSVTSFRILSSTRVTDKCITGFNACLATSKPGRYTLLKRRQVNQQFKGLRKPATIIIKPGCSILNTIFLLADIDIKILTVNERELLMYLFKYMYTIWRKCCVVKKTAFNWTF